MEEDITKKPLVDIIKQLTELDQKIDIDCLKIDKAKKQIKDLNKELDVLVPQYNQLRSEVIRRFPTEDFKKNLKKKIRKIN